MQVIGLPPFPISTGHGELVRWLSPIVEEGLWEYEAGATLRSLMCKAVTAAYLAGRGFSPAGALDLLLCWRASGIAPDLALQIRAEPGAGAPVALRHDQGVEELTGAEASARVAAAPDPDVSGSSGRARADDPLVTVQREELLARIERYMKEQITAARFYRRLLELAEDERVRSQIRRAMEDEEKHYRLLGELYQTLTSRSFAAEPEPVAFASLAEGLMIAFADELEAFEEYRETYLQQVDERIRRLFFELMTDEHEHATRFAFALHLIRT